MHHRTAAVLFEVRQQTAHEFVKAGDLRVQMLLPQRVGEFIDQQLMRHARCRKHQSVDAPMGLNRLSDHAADARRICRVELVQRCGDARALYRSARRILALPDETRLFMCHDYGTSQRGMAWETTVAEERARNIHVGDGIDEQTFVDKRTARDAMLDMPRLILPSLQVNMKAGRLPEADTAGKRFLKVPIDGL